MAFVHELKGSGDFTKGPTGTNGTLRYLVFGDDVTTSDLAYAAVFNDTYAPLFVGGIPRGSTRITQQSPTYYVIEIDYEGSVRTEAGTNAGGDPGPIGGEVGGGNPAGGIPGSAEANAGEFSFSTGGGTERLYVSRETKHSCSNNQGAAPSFNRMIGVSKNGVEGCEVYSRECEFSVSKQYEYLSVGYILRLFAMTGTVNADIFYACAPGEVVFKGADGNGTVGAEKPWKITGRFGYMPNWTSAQLQVTDDLAFTQAIDGWDYVWYVYEQTTEEVGGVQYMVERPKHGYCERVYDRTQFSVLNMDL